MADDDEIDVLGEFSFDSCLAQNNQGIPSCSDREDTVHPHWLLDSTGANWYDKQRKDSASRSDGPQVILTGNRGRSMKNNIQHTAWTPQEKEKLVKEMAKYGRNVRKISQTIKTKSEVEIQALIEAEYGVHLEATSFSLDKTHDDNDDIPVVGQEEIITEEETPDLQNVISLVTTGSPTINIPKKLPFKKKQMNRSKNSLLKPDILNDVKNEPGVIVNAMEIFYDDDMIIGSTESIGGSDVDSRDVALSVKFGKNPKSNKPKLPKKTVNHRRKVSRNYDKGPIRNRSKDNVKSPQGRVRKDSSLSEDSTKSPKLQIVFSSGQALPVSEGEQVIKIEKNKESEAESDIEIDVDSDGGGASPAKPASITTASRPRQLSESEPAGSKKPEEPIAVPLSKFEPMPRRQKKLNLDGEGGYTIMHTAEGDLYAVGAEPRRDRAPKKAPVHLIQCRVYNAERPAPYQVRVHVSTLIEMDVHGHTSRGEVMGLLGGEMVDGVVTLRAYRPAAAAATRTHCDMDPVSQALAAESLRAAGHALLGWHHTHPSFPPTPSALDLRTQAALQRALERRTPFLAFVTSQAQPRGRQASQYRCFRVESTPEDPETGFQLSAALVPDVTPRSLPELALSLRALRPACADEYTVRMAVDVCPQAQLTYMHKCTNSIRHHLHSAGYEDDDPIVEQVLKTIRDIFR